MILDISVILDYCAEGSLTEEENSEICTLKLDKNAEMFAQSAEAIQGNKDEMISIKLTGLMEGSLLRKLN